MRDQPILTALIMQSLACPEKLASMVEVVN